MPEVFGVRLPPASESLTSVDFDLIPNKPPPGTKVYDEEIEEIEESESEEDDDDEDMEPAAIPAPVREQDAMAAVGPVSAIPTPSDIDMLGTPNPAADEGSDGRGEEEEEEEEDGLFAGGEEEEEESGDDHTMDNGQISPNGAGIKRKLVEEEDYD